MKRFLIGLVVALVLSVIVAIVFPHAFGGNRLVIGVIAFAAYVVLDAITTPRKARVPRNAAPE